MSTHTFRKLALMHRLVHDIDSYYLTQLRDMLLEELI